MDTDTARKRLESERARLQGLVDRLPEHQTPQPGDVADQGADAATDVFDEEMRDSVAEELEAELEEIEAALERLEDGSYGVCEIGGETIPDERLEALPATRYCVEHQQQVERQRAAGGYEGADPTI